MSILMLRLLIISNVLGRHIAAFVPDSFETQVASRDRATCMTEPELGAYDVIFIAHCSDDPDGMEELYQHLDPILRDRGRYVVSTIHPDQVKLSSASLVIIPGIDRQRVQEGLAEAMS